MTRLRPPIRRLARRAARLPCQVVRERDFRLVADQVLNLSSGGVLVGPADPVLTGERVIVSFRAQAGWVDAEAVVARVVHGRRNGEHSRSLGLCFDSLDAASRQALERALQMCVPVPPGQRSERRVASR
ncbi:MAG: PilZ domain-containing protein [Myxococcota bacterium]|jgi:PilZ domain|nr:PilZ domain-containing protein [Myxococcota bacterium]